MADKMTKKDYTGDFCAELRDRTKKIHDQSDRLINLKLAVVLTDTPLWGEVLTDFYFVFQTIESCLDSLREHPVLGQLHHPAILRREAFEKDLEFYLGKSWPGEVRPSPPAEEYCNRIVDAVQENPLLLIAYVHSMYLGLVAGGQLIKRIIKRTLGITGQDGGLAIFEFKDMNKTELRQHIYKSINSIELSREEKYVIIQEKIRCFQMNNAIASNVKPSFKSTKRLSAFVLMALLVLFILIMMLVYFVMYLSRS